MPPWKTWCTSVSKRARFAGSNGGRGLSVRTAGRAERGRSDRRSPMSLFLRFFACTAEQAPSRMARSLRSTQSSYSASSSSRVGILREAGRTCRRSRSDGFSKPTRQLVPIAVPAPVPGRVGTSRKLAPSHHHHQRSSWPATSLRKLCIGFGHCPDVWPYDGSSEAVRDRLSFGFARSRGHLAAAVQLV
jgi:hypothetical protein